MREESPRAEFKPKKNVARMAMRSTLILTAVVAAIAVWGIGIVLADHDVVDTGIPTIWQEDTNIFTGGMQDVYKSVIEDCSLVINKIDLVNNTHDMSLAVAMMCNDEDEVDYITYDPETEESNFVESELGPFDYGIQEIEECDFNIRYESGSELELENSTFSLDFPESIRIEIDCTIDD